MNAVAPDTAVTGRPPEPKMPPGHVLVPSQRELLSRLAKVMRFVAAGLVVFAVLQLLASGFAAVAVVQTALMLLVGGLTWNVGGRFGRVADTRGRDLQQLFEAIDGLRMLFTIQAAVMVLAALLIVLAIAFVALR